MTAKIGIGSAIIAVSFSQLIGEEILPKTATKESVGVAWVFAEIPGTTLQSEIRSQIKSGVKNYQYSIGYQRRSKGGFIFIPVISLPRIENDRYQIDFSEGNLIISIERTEIPVASVDLDAIAPHTITEIGKSTDDLAKTLTGQKPIESEIRVLHENHYSIKNTTLKIESQITVKKDSPDWFQHECKVGYEQSGIIVPILSVPPLENNFYFITVIDSKLVVQTIKTKREVFSLHLDKLAPGTLSFQYFGGNWFLPSTEREFFEIVRKLQKEEFGNGK